MYHTVGARRLKEAVSLLEQKVVLHKLLAVSLHTYDKDLYCMYMNKIQSYDELYQMDQKITDGITYKQRM